MPTNVKIKIDDNEPLRNTLNSMDEECSQHDLAKWSLALTAHIFMLAGYDISRFATVLDALNVNKSWQLGEARMHDVRQAGFQVHKLARASKSNVLQTVLRVAGHAVGTGHMREHAMVASDYAIKVITLLHPGDFEAIASERQWQITTLQAIATDQRH